MIKKQYKEWNILSKYLSWDEIFIYFKKVYHYETEEELTQVLNNYLNNLPIKDIEEYEREILNNDYNRIN
ncbi:hypothetical protein C6B38_00390 [Spiroplasma sp. ChiS]|uniref:hypothetical protein n=1 Tax=Spiroplasma sp. ChiS TaxID=2099885 RepID=UPI000CF9FF4E|nr:hypothetical protein [Spiroplasma sp. ChiS]PQP79706.1 hypothetical protein C6B38_00390 [Spiroplasma sp. ChiS]